MQRELDEIDKEIQAMAEILSRTRHDDPSIRRLLTRLANAHDKRFDLRHELVDIHIVIEFRSIVLNLIPDDDPGLPKMLSALGTSHSERFLCLRSQDDVEKAIEYKTMALELIPKGDPDLPRQFMNLAASHKDRFEHLGELADIEKAIKCDLRAVEMTAADSPSLPERLASLGTSHNYRFERLGELPDLEQAIKHQRRALDLTPDGHPDLPIHLTNIAVSYSNRFKRLGELPDLEQAIEYERRVLALTPNGHPDLSRSLGNLAVSYSSRFERLGELPDLEQAIDYQHRALALATDSSPDIPDCLANLAGSYGLRFKRLSELPDLEKAIDYQRRVLDLTPDGHPDLSNRLANLAVSYRIRFERMDVLLDLEKAIDYQRRALSLTPDGHPGLSNRFGHLAVACGHRFKRLGQLTDLEQAIEYERRVLALTPDGHPGLSNCLANLAVFYENRFKHLGELPDLKQAIDYECRALASTPDDHPDLPSRLTNLAGSFSDRFERLGEPQDLEQAIDYQRRALDLTPDDHPHLSSQLANLAVSYKDQFKRLGELSDLEQAIDYETRALALTPDGHPHLPKHLGNLAISYKIRFECLGELLDLEQAIKYGARALAAITSDHPDSSVLQFHHAISHVIHYNHSHDPSHLHKALPLFRHASTSSAASPRDRFNKALHWASLASKHDVLNPIEAYQVTIDLLPQFIWLGAPADQRYQDLKSVQTLAVNAAHATILSSNHSLALEWLEHARCIAWTQNLMLRSPLDQLLDSHPALATRLQTVAAELHTAGSNSRESLALSRSMTSEQIGLDHRRLAREYEDLLTQVRTQPGFKDFLQPMKTAALMRTARNGPIVVINCHEERSDAILVLPSQSTITHLELPSFSAKNAQHAHSIIQSLLGHKGIRERGIRFLDVQGDEPKFHWQPVLKTLWADVVKPVLECLGFTVHSPGNLNKIPHLTWCPTGPASFLPFHAAGDYNQPVGSRVFDYVVSSYTPTLTALLASNPSTLSHNSQVLAIGQANTPGHSPLPGTTMELKHIKTHIENRARYSELTDAQATPEAVLDAMEQHDWVHLACHAHQNVYDPTKSGFLLHEGTLDLMAINRRSFKSKGLAFLSACQTAKGDEALPNEAVHLASGMLMAGYSSVIATMWSVGDAEAPFVADKVYSQLMKEGTLGNGEAGRALHDAVAGLRESIGEKEFGRWVPFIHIGS